MKPSLRAWSLALLIATGAMLLIVGAFVATGAVRAATPTPTLLPPTTPTPDPTVTMLQKEKLNQEVRQLQNQNDNSLSSLLRSNITILVTAAVGLFGIVRWLGDRRDERQKRAEEGTAPSCPASG